MNITKLGHCCLVIEVNNIRIVTDPGAWTTAQNEVKGIDAILITHEHADHLHVDSLRVVLAHNPQAVVLTNQAVGNILTKENISYELLEEGGIKKIQGVVLEGHGSQHADIYPTVPAVQNTGYFIDSRLFYPGDALYNPGKAVGILALPVAGPWLKIAEAIDYAKNIAPKICFPVHDGMLKITGPFHLLPEKMLKEEGIDFIVLEEGKERVF